MRPSPSNGGADPAELARTLRNTAITTELAGSLARSGIPTMAIKGPHVQDRLLGTPFGYASADVDLLVRRGDGRAARRLLRRLGWTHHAANGRLWRLDRAAAFERDDVTVDLHWGLHLGLVNGRKLHRLEQEMWSGVEPSPEGLSEAPLPALTVYLALHASTVRMHPAKLQLVHAGASTASREEVLRVAERCGVFELVDATLALAKDPSRDRPSDGSVVFPASASWLARLRNRARGRYFRASSGRRAR